MQTSNGFLEATFSFRVWGRMLKKKPKQRKTWLKVWLQKTIWKYRLWIKILEDFYATFCAKDGEDYQRKFFQRTKIALALRACAIWLSFEKFARANLSQIDLAIMLSLILIRRLCCRLASSLQEFGTSFLHYEIMDRTDTLHFYFSNYTTECFVSVWKRIVGYYISLCLAEFLFLQYVT